MLGFKGIKIKDNILRRVGGGGKCVTNCISIHTTGTENESSEIRINVNRHIIENWEVYSDSFEYPYNDRVGAENKTFYSQEDLLIFLIEEERQASTMWMTQVCMQAVSTMLNMDIDILTTGIHPPNSQRCARCQPGIKFESEENLREHNRVVHNKTESEEEKEGKLQKSRWTQLRPDPRISQSNPNEKANKMVLLHEDDVHYNLIVTKVTTNSRNKVNQSSIPKNST